MHRVRILLRLTSVLWLTLLGRTAWSMTPAEARHLLVRTGFGATPQEIDRFSALSFEQAVDELLNSPVATPLTPPPDWTRDSAIPERKPKDMKPDEKMAFEMKLHQEREDLRAWWCFEMVSSSSPLTERMTLFWHNHFTSGFEKVRWPGLMYRQNLLLRRHALGNFRSFLEAIATDPAMILYLDTQSNHKGHPNENFARELLELFTLGIGRYSEKDIQEAARAFTGWQVDMNNGEFVFRPRQHDTGMKTFLGERGNFEGVDILQIILKQPRTGEFISEKLWREFISDKPNAAEVKKLGALFRSQNYELKPLLRALLLEPAFRAEANRGSLTKSPADLIIGTIHTFNMPVQNGNELVPGFHSMGQDLFEPPNVKGWPGGTWWITSYTLLARHQFLTQLLRGKEMEGQAPTPTMTMEIKKNHETLHGIDLNDWMGKSGFKDAEDSQKLVQVLLALPPANPLWPHSDLSQEIRALVLDPVYQLK